MFTLVDLPDILTIEHRNVRPQGSPLAKVAKLKVALHAHSGRREARPDTGKPRSSWHVATEFEH